MEHLYVHRTYDAIAPHFSATRFAIWPKVREFIVGLPPGAYVVDVGCGNGKYFSVRRDLLVLGFDVSANLVQQAKGKIEGALLVVLSIIFFFCFFFFVFNISIRVLRCVLVREHIPIRMHHILLLFGCIR